MDTVEIKKYETRAEITESLRVERNLDGADLSSLDLAGIELAMLSMKGADLHDSNLSEAKLTCIDMSEVDLSNALAASPVHGHRGPGRFPYLAATEGERLEINRLMQ